MNVAFSGSSSHTFNHSTKTKTAIAVWRGRPLFGGWGHADVHFRLPPLPWEISTFSLSEGLQLYSIRPSG